MTSISMDRSARSSLAEELRELGVPVLPYGAVALHKWRFFYANQKGFWKLVAPITYILSGSLVHFLFGVILLVLATIYGFLPFMASKGLYAHGLVLAGCGAVVFLIAACYFTTWGFRWHLGFVDVAKDPARLQDRARRVSSFLEGVEVRKLHLATDPFYIAIRSHGIFKEICYIGAWNTGNRRLDNA